jgi:hypothetical protein
MSEPGRWTLYGEGYFIPESLLGGEQVDVLEVAAVKDALRAIRYGCVSGRDEMHAVDEAWMTLFGDSADAPWKKVSDAV